MSSLTTGWYHRYRLCEVTTLGEHEAEESTLDLSRACPSWRKACWFHGRIMRALAYCL